MTYKTIVLPVAASLCALAGVMDAARSAAQPEITLERIMSDPDWIGAPVKDAYWSVDGRAAYYSVKRSGSPIIDLHRIDIGNRTDRIVDAQAMAEPTPRRSSTPPANVLHSFEMTTYSSATLPAAGSRKSRARWRRKRRRNSPPMAAS